jgi:hypothetical protein
MGSPANVFAGEPLYFTPFRLAIPLSGFLTRIDRHRTKVQFSRLQISAGKIFLCPYGTKGDRAQFKSEIGTLSTVPDSTPNAVL